MKAISIEELKNHLLAGDTIIDVRAPIEFEAGSIPGSINLPVLDNDERHQVGKCFKSQGQDAAIALGHQLVSGENLEKKISAWQKALTENPKAVITCFRGGLRSQSTQKFLLERGLLTARLGLGYKAARQFLSDYLTQDAAQFPMVILSGTTGSGKTHLLNDLVPIYPAIDLEGLAHHRGSAFGAWDIAQPAQADFENRLSFKLLRLTSEKKILKPILFEDESRMIGTCHIPEPFFLKMRNAPVVLVQESVATRTDNIYVDYISSKIHPATTSDQSVQAILAKYKKSVEKIQKKLGGLRAQELLADLDRCEKQYLDSKEISGNKIWIEKLLVWYYDPMYVGSLEKRNPQIQFQGTRAAIKEYFLSLNSSAAAQLK